MCVRSCVCTCVRTCMYVCVCVCDLEDVGEVSQVEDVVEAYGGRQEVLADLLVQTDSCLLRGKRRETQRSYSCTMRVLCQRCLTLRHKPLGWISNTFSVTRRK